MAVLQTPSPGMSPVDTQELGLDMPQAANADAKMPRMVKKNKRK